MLADDVVDELSHRVGVADIQTDGGRAGAQAGGNLFGSVGVDVG
jgi:hypothetical protein